jgi:pyrroloquinoline quinone biosynthesis protein D
MSGHGKTNGTAQRAVISPASKPAFPRGTKLWHDKVQGRWVILAPERVFKLDDVAIAVLQLCDGARTVEQIALELSVSYNAPKERILADITPMLQQLADKGVVRA